MCNLPGCDHKANGAVAAWRHVETSERFDDGGLLQYVLNGQGRVELGQGVERGVAAVLDRDCGKIAPGGPGLEQVTVGVQRVPGDRRHSERSLEIYVACRTYPGFHHGRSIDSRVVLYSQCERCFDPSAPYVCAGLVEGQAAGNAQVCDFGDLPVTAQPQPARHERGEGPLARGRCRCGEYGGADISLFKAGRAHGIEHQVCQDFMFEARLFQPSHFAGCVTDDYRFSVVIHPGSGYILVRATC